MSPSTPQEMAMRQWSSRLLGQEEAVDVNFEDDCGRNPLSSAAGNGHKAVDRLLSAAKEASTDFKDKYGRTTLSYSAEKGNELVVNQLLDRDDAEVRSEDTHDQTPYWWASC